MLSTTEDKRKAAQDVFEADLFGPCDKGVPAPEVENNIRKSVLELINKNFDPVAFLSDQVANIEAGVDPVDHSEIQYPTFMHVETGDNQWVDKATYFSVDMTGTAQWFGGYAQDMPFVDIVREKHEVPINMAAIGYMYGLEELIVAQKAGWTLTSERASAARETANRFVDIIAKVGNKDKRWLGLYNQEPHNVATGRSNRSWFELNDKMETSRRASDVDILRDINMALSGLFRNDHGTFLISNTLIVPPIVFSFLASTNTTHDNTLSLYNWVRHENIYSKSNKDAPINIYPGIGLEEHGYKGRIIGYPKRPEVVQLHYPMPHNFRPLREIGAGIGYVVPGIMRIGGVEVAQPSAIHYVDGIWSD